MKLRKLTIERLIVEESTEQEREQLRKDGYEYKGDNYSLDAIYEKVISRE